ncbi:hypothetical protein Bca101_020093 [Brassica carinata]
MGLCSISPKEEGAVTRRFVQKGGKKQVVPVRPEGGTCSPRQLADPFLYKYRPWGRDLPQFSLRKALPKSSTDDEYQRQGERLGEGLEHSRAHTQGEWDGPSLLSMAAVEFRVGCGGFSGSRPISSQFLIVHLLFSFTLYVDGSDQDRGKAKEP